jgi:cytoskeleton protein RodZ
MTVIGETLRRERLRRNLGLDEISRELKISAKFLEAIEDERFDKLPRGVFAKSFVRQYARLLGLDEEELAGEVQRVVEPPSAGPQFAERAPQAPSEIHVPRVEAWETVADNRRFSRSSSLPALAMVVVVMLVCSGVYALWQRSRRQVSSHEEAPAQTAQVQQSRLPHTEPGASPETTPPQSSRVQPSAQNSADRPTGEGAPPRPPEAKPDVSTAVPGAATVSPASASAPEPGTKVQIPNSNPNAPVHLAVTADEMVWVLVKTDGQFSFSGTLEANQTRTFDANGTVMLRLGNAGGVTIKLNGQSIGAVGPKGQVRTVQFTSGGFQIVAAPKPSLPLDDLR